MSETVETPSPVSESTPSVPSVPVTTAPVKSDKPGYQTTEFWLSLGGNLVGLLVLSGVFSANDAQHVTAAYNEVVGSVMLGLTNLTYIWSRTHVKGNTR